jgi:hypothetical protein
MSRSSGHSLETLKVRWSQAKIHTTNATQTAHLTLWPKNMDTTAELLTSITPLHQPTNSQDGLRSTHSFSWTRTHPTAVPDLKALALTLSKVFHRGQLSHSTGTLITTDLNNWTAEETTPREIRVLSILLPDLTDTAETKKHFEETTAPIEMHANCKPSQKKRNAQKHASSEQTSTFVTHSTQCRKHLSGP